jgi:small subunit ribosomal protein S8
MTMSDPIADMLTRIRNASQRKHRTVSLPSSRLKVEIARILSEEGFIDSFQVAETEKFPILKLKLRYTEDREPVITQLSRISKPGCRVYSKRKEISWVLQGMGISILTTPKGVMTGRQARRENVGGEVLCHVY